MILAGGCQHYPAEVEAPTIDDEYTRAEACWRNQDFACADRLLTPPADPAATADRRAIYLAGLVAVDIRNPAQDIEKAADCFRQLTTRHPETTQAAQAAVWLGLIAQMDAQAEAISRLEAGKTSMQQKIENQQAQLRLMKKRLERLKAVDLSLE